MNRLAATLALLLTAGVGAAAWSLAGHSHEPPKPATRIEAPALPRGRIAVTPAQSQQAYAAGLIDRPIKSLLDVRKPMHYGEFIWNDAGVPAGPVWIRVDLHAQLMSVF